MHTSLSHTLHTSCLFTFTFKHHEHWGTLFKALKVSQTSSCKYQFWCLSVNKHTQQSSPSLSTSSIYSQCSESWHSSHHLSSQSLKDLNTHSVSLKKHCWLQLSCFELINNQHLQVTCLSSALLWSTCVFERENCRSQLLTDSSVDA